MKHTLLCLALLAAPALAGPPGGCIDIEIGAAKSLPWGKTGQAGAKDYTATQAVTDTLKLLDAQMPPLVRMETIRRAVLYIADNPAQRNRLFAALRLRALDAETMKKAPRWAWFDAGYAQGCFEQYGLVDGLRGYAWLREESEGGAARHFALAILALPGPDAKNFPLFKHHLALAKKTKDPLLLKNIERFEKLAKGLIEHVRDRHTKTG